MQLIEWKFIWVSTNVKRFNDIMTRERFQPHKESAQAEAQAQSFCLGHNLNYML